MKSPTDKLVLEQHDNTLLITLNNPPAHTWDEENLAGLKDIVAQANADRDVYALVITGSGEKFFSAGADLKLFADGEKGVAATMAAAFGSAFEALSSFRGVSIAAINGYAMGGGLECALACDLRIAESHAQMALPEATVGLLPCGGGTQNLAWAVGEAWAKRMILCGERVDAATAERIGLVEEVVEQGQAREAALALAAKVGKQSPPAVAACKSLIQAARGGGIRSAYAAEREAFVGLFDTADQREGVNAFLEKRQAEWVNG
ncbi:MAG: enoyl-CoA hydratase [Gammaproteobacteria bacterium]|jgi:enoyl-CoA hydratase/carnithine racemase|nr:enoyl-CoA hydratase [Gammaproteobacteria bacterium]|tara:strand:- start:431 stop:1216 length:786 start_codon:yes stop_codon:yes gene_type:complete